MGKIVTESPCEPLLPVEELSLNYKKKNNQKTINLVTIDDETVHNHQCDDKHRCVPERFVALQLHSVIGPQ